MTPQGTDDAADEPEDDPGDDTADAGGDGGPAPAVPASMRQSLAIMALLAMAAGLLIAIVSIMDAISTWLKPRYVDLAQGAFGLVLAGASLVALAWIAREWEPPEG